MSVYTLYRRISTGYRAISRFSDSTSITVRHYANGLGKKLTYTTQLKCKYNGGDVVEKNRNKVKFRIGARVTAKTMHTCCVPLDLRMTVVG